MLREFALGHPVIPPEPKPISVFSLLLQCRSIVGTGSITLFYLDFLLQDTKQTISLIQGQEGNWAVSQ